MRSSGERIGNPMTEQEQLFAFVRETTTIAKEMDVVEKWKSRKTVKPETDSTYRKAAKTRFKVKSITDQGRLMDGVSSRSWHAVKAALTYVAQDTYIQARRDCDAAQKAKHLDLARNCAKIARASLVAIQKIEDAQRPELTTPRASKRRSLPKTDDWQINILRAATPTQQPSIAVMWATGSRPCEIESGVSITHVIREGRRVILAHILGAKVSETTGQPERKIYLDPDSDQGRVLAAVLGDDVSRTIQRSAKRLNKDLADIRQKTGINVSPYSFRHQISANLKSENGEEGAKKTASALGHITTRSQGRYGSVRQAQSGGTGVVDVRASKTVKETRSIRSIPGPNLIDDKDMPRPV